jgi:putative transposase
VSMTTESKKDLEPEARRLRRELFDDELLDKLLAATSERGLSLTGEGGFLPEMIKAVLERGMEAELTDHLGYDKHDPAGTGSGNSRNGTTPKTVGTEVGDIGSDQPRDRNSTFASALVPKGACRLGGLEEMIISLYAGGMTIRDIQHHFAATWAPSCPTRRSARSPTPSPRRSPPGKPARWRRSTR